MWPYIVANSAIFTRQRPCRATPTDLFVHKPEGTWFTQPNQIWLYGDSLWTHPLKPSFDFFIGQIHAQEATYGRNNLTALSVFSS